MNSKLTVFHIGSNLCKRKHVSHTYMILMKMLVFRVSSGFLNSKQSVLKNETMISLYNYLVIKVLERIGEKRPSK